MRYLVIFFLVSFSAAGQALRDINYNFLYNPAEPIELNMHVARSGDGWKAFYRLTAKDTTADASFYLIQWDIRQDLGQKEGTPVAAEHVTKTISRNTINGTVDLDSASERQYVVAKVLNNSTKRAWLFAQAIDPKYPVNNVILRNGSPAFSSFVPVNNPVSIKGDGDEKIVSYYNDDFPAAVPGFSEGMARVARSMRVDSTFFIRDGESITLKSRGLYLVQTDTNSTRGFAFRAEEDYPRLAKIESLADPLIYICTKQEFDRIKAAKGDKKAFDRVILSITKDADRAKNFMRSYFRRVELANTYFTSYKEGWKTDRGMIYIVFGLPDQIYRFTDREVWTYKNNQYKASFDFVKSSTLFDPENFVLVRDKKFQQTWYEVIDLWRNARF